MKFKHILVLFILGSIGVTIGALFKIQHWPGASIILAASVCIEILGAIMAVWKLLTVKDFSDFLNK